MGITGYTYLFGLLSIIILWCAIFMLEVDVKNTSRHSTISTKDAAVMISTKGTANAGAGTGSDGTGNPLIITTAPSSAPPVTVTAPPVDIISSPPAHVETQPPQAPITHAPGTSQQKQEAANVSSQQSSRCHLEHFQENHWNCSSRRFQHSCNASQLAAGLAYWENIHFVGDSLSRNRFMTSSLELSGSLPLNESICPQAEVEWTLDYFIQHCRQRDCIHEHYNHYHYVSSPYNLTIYHDLALYNAGVAPNVIQALGPKDVMFFSIGAWINYDVSYHVPRIQQVMKLRPNKGELVFWIGVDYVGHLKPVEHLEKGQNNSNAEAYNAYMHDHHKELGFDGYIDFYNLTKFADQCASVDQSDWANFDGTHATAEPNRMIYLGLLKFLEPWWSSKIVHDTHAAGSAQSR